MSLLVPIILVNYNNTRDTEKCILSLNASRVITPFIIIVDNASNNKEKVFALKKTSKNIHIIINSQNYGFGRANNIGIKWAQENIDFDYLLLLNNDTLVEKDAINRLIHSFALDSKIGITTSKTMYESNRDIVWYGGGEINYKRGWPRITDFNQQATADGANKSRYVSFASGCVMMFTKESIAQLKGFDDDFFMYCEDLELSIRALKEGWKIYYCADSVIYHKVQGSMNKEKSVTGLNPKNPNLSFQLYHKKVNQWLTFKKHLAGSEFRRFQVNYWLLFSRKILELLVSSNSKHDLFKVTVQITKKIKSYK